MQLSKNLINETLMSIITSHKNSCDGLAIVVSGSAPYSSSSVTISTFAARCAASCAATADVGGIVNFSNSSSFEPILMEVCSIFHQILNVLNFLSRSYTEFPRMFLKFWRIGLGGWLNTFWESTDFHGLVGPGSKYPCWRGRRNLLLNFAKIQFTLTKIGTFWRNFC